MKLTQLIAMLACLALPTLVQAQDNTGLMRSNGRIYVVVAVMLTILLGLILYLFRLDNKMKRLERESRD